MTDDALLDLDPVEQHLLDRPAVSSAPSVVELPSAEAQQILIAVPAARKALTSKRETTYTTGVLPATKDWDIMSHSGSLWENCEVGLAQRPHNIDPGRLVCCLTMLLRTLRQLLGQRSESLDKHREIAIRAASEEYMVVARVFDWHMHSCTYTARIGPNLLIEREFGPICYQHNRTIHLLSECCRIFILYRRPLQARSALRPPRTLAIRSQGFATMFHLTLIRASTLLSEVVGRIRRAGTFRDSPTRGGSFRKSMAWPRRYFASWSYVPLRGALS